MHRTRTLASIAVAATFTTAAFAENEAGFESSDTAATLLKRKTDQQVQLVLTSGEKIGGKVEMVGDHAVHLSALTGQEFYDAVVLLDQISAVIVRTGGR